MLDQHFCQAYIFLAVGLVDHNQPSCEVAVKNSPLSDFTADNNLKNLINLIVSTFLSR